MEHFSASKARGVARTALIEIEISVASLSCARRVLYHNSRGIALHLSAASDGKVCQMRCINSNCKFRRPNKNPLSGINRIFARGPWHRKLPFAVIFRCLRAFASKAALTRPPAKPPCITFFVYVVLLCPVGWAFFSC